MITKHKRLFNGFNLIRRPAHERGLSLTGLTLIELLVVLVLAVIVMGVVTLVLREGLGAWKIGEGQVTLQRQTQRIMEEIIEGTDKSVGIREALEVIEATDVSLGLIPLWVDLYPNYMGDDKGEFILSKEFKPGGSVPLGQIRTPQGKSFISVPVVFIYGETGDFDSSAAVKFINPIPAGSDVRILFYPDASVDYSVIMRYYWDKELNRIFRTYKGETQDIIKRDKKLKVTDFKFSYYDNLNNLLVPVYGTDVERAPDISRETSGRSSLSAIGIEFVVEKDLVKRELSSFVSIRGLGGNLGTGLALSETTEIEIPDSRNIRTLVLDNIHGIKNNDRLEIEIGTSTGRIWKISIEFGIIEEKPYVLSFNVEYPKGTIVYSNTRQRPVGGGLNLLKIGNDYYDYDNDANVKDSVNIEGEAILKVVKMDVDAAAVFVRP